MIFFWAWGISNSLGAALSLNARPRLQLYVAGIDLFYMTIYGAVLIEDEFIGAAIWTS